MAKGWGQNQMSSKSGRCTGVGKNKGAPHGRGIGVWGSCCVVWSMATSAEGGMDRSEESDNCNNNSFLGECGRVYHCPGGNPCWYSCSGHRIHRVAISRSLSWTSSYRVVGIGILLEKEEERLGTNGWRGAYTRISKWLIIGWVLRRRIILVRGVGAE